MTGSVRVSCPAKINLCLEVIGRREDGYHELCTIFQAVSLADELTLTTDANPPLTVSGLSVPVEGNLCLKAAEAFAERFPQAPCVGMSLHKVVPWGAGLGGGSSDAAGTLAGLAHLSGLDDREALPTLATTLGSDVPFFLSGGTALGRGRGELLEALAPPTGEWLVLAKPEMVVPTHLAYGLLRAEDFTAGEHTAALADALRAGCVLHKMAPCLYNVFARAIEEHWPAIRRTREMLLEHGASAALLSGSGAAVFGVFAEREAAEAAATQISAQGIWAVTAQPVSHGVQVSVQR